MPHNVTRANTIQGGGMTIGQAVVRNGDGLGIWRIDLPAGAAGSLTTRTNDTVGEVTASSGSHGITTGATVDLYWTGGRRYGVTVGTVSGTAIPISGGSGDVLPSTSTAVVVTEQVSATVNIDGDNIQLLAIELQLPIGDSSKGHCQFKESGAADIHTVDLAASIAQVWDVAGGDTNNFTGNPITTLKASNGSSANAAVLALLSLEDATP